MDSIYTGPVTGPRYLTGEEARHYLESTLNYTTSEAINAVNGALAIEGGVYRSLAAHDVSYVIEDGRHLGYLITRGSFTREQHFTKDVAETWTVFMHAMGKIHSRVPAEYEKGQGQ